MNVNFESLNVLLPGSVFSPISGDLSGHAALAVNGTASRISPAVSSGEVRPAPNGVPHVAPQQMQAEFQQYMSSETSGMLRNRDNAVSMLNWPVF